MRGKNCGVRTEKERLVLKSEQKDGLAQCFWRDNKHWHACIGWLTALPTCVMCVSSCSRARSSRAESRASSSRRAAAPASSTRSTKGQTSV